MTFNMSSASYSYIKPKPITSKQCSEYYSVVFVNSILFALSRLETNDKAMKYLQKAFTISRHLYIRPLEAEILLYMGNVHAINPKEQDYAQAAYEAAKMIFIELNDMENERKVNFLKAKCKATQIFPKLIKLLESDDYCNRYDLLRWKTRCVPFWCSERMKLQERQWSMALRNELRDENKKTEEIIKKNKSRSALKFFKNTNGSEEDMDQQYEEHWLANTEKKSLMTLAVDESDINKEKDPVKEEKTVRKYMSEDINLSQIRFAEIPAYRDKIDKKHRMLDYQKLLQLNFVENREQPPSLNCLIKEFSNSRSKINPKQQE